MYDEPRDRLSLGEWVLWAVGLVVGVIIVVLKLSEDVHFGWEWVVAGPIMCVILFPVITLAICVVQAFLELTDVMSPNLDVKVKQHLRCWIQEKTIRQRTELTEDEIHRQGEAIRKDLIERKQSSNKVLLKGFVVITAVIGGFHFLTNAPPWLKLTCMIVFWLLLLLSGIGSLIDNLSSNVKGSKFHHKRGLDCLLKKEYDQAIAAFSEAIRLDPKCVVAFFDRGNAWTDKKEYEKAIVDFSEAIRLSSKCHGAFCNRGNAWWAKREYSKALADYSEAIRHGPNEAVYYRNCALVLAVCPEASLRDGKRAIELGTKACELTHWTGAWEIAALAAAYAENGQFDEAEQYQIRAFDVPNSSDENRSEFRKRLELYKQKLPYRETVAIRRSSEVAEDARRAAVVSERDGVARRAVEELVRHEQEERQKAKNLELWAQTGMPRQWVLEHLDGWDYSTLAVLCDKLKSTAFWPIRIDAMVAYLERLRDELQSEQNRKREEGASNPRLKALLFEGKDCGYVTYRQLSSYLDACVFRIEPDGPVKTLPDDAEHQERLSMLLAVLDAECIELIDETEHAKIEPWLSYKFVPD
jgi:tetratricopeptide (TPR) repeat protein